MLAESLYNINLFLDGIGYQGVVTQVTPPQIKQKTDDFQGGGMDMPYKVSLGMEAMEASFSIMGNIPEALSAWGKADQSVVFRAAFKKQNGETIPCSIIMRGLIHTVEPGDWKPGEKGENKFTMACSYYKMERGSRIIYEIDALGTVCIVDGIDLLSDIRSALGT